MIIEPAVSQDTRGLVSELTLDECLEKALTNNPDIEIKTLEIINDERDIIAEEAAFDPELATGFSYADSKRPSASIVSGNRRKTTEFNLGFQGLRKDGNSFGLELSQVKSDTNSTFSALNPSYTMDLALSYVQPLGRGRGRNVTLSLLRISKLNKDISELELKSTLMDLVYNVETAYWNLVFAEKVLEARKESLRLAEETLERTRGMIEAGAMAESQVLLVESQLASRREDVISAEGNLQKAALALKLNMRVSPGSELWRKEIHPAGSDIKVLEIASIPFETGLETALANRPDHLKTTKNMEVAEIRLETARDRTKPSIDLQTTIGVGGLKDNYSRSLQDITSMEYPSWEVGLWLDTPVGRREARARLEQRQNDKLKVKLEAETTTQEIAIEIADAEISLKTTKNRLEASAVTREYTEKKLREEEEKHTLGIATTHDVLEYQEDLALSRMNEYSAMAEYNMAVNDYYMALGIILEKKNIRISSSGF